MNRFVLGVTLLFCVVGAVLGARIGWRYAHLSETEVITAAVARYLEAEQARGHRPAPTDCSARPDMEEAIWIVVTCIPLSDPATARHDYQISRFGQIKRVSGCLLYTSDAADD